MSFVYQTFRLTLRHFTLNDAEFVIHLLNQPSFIENIADKGVRTIKEANEYLHSGPMASYQQYGFGLNAVTLTETGLVIGMCGLIKRPELAVPDIGYAFLPEFWRKGYAKEAAQAVVINAKQHHVNTLAAITNIDNVSSIKLLEALGFKQLKTMVLYQGEPECRYFERNDQC